MAYLDITTQKLYRNDQIGKIKKTDLTKHDFTFIEDIIATPIKWLISAGEEIEVAQAGHFFDSPLSGLIIKFKKPLQFVTEFPEDFTFNAKELTLESKELNDESWAKFLLDLSTAVYDFTNWAAEYCSSIPKA